MRLLIFCIFYVFSQFNLLATDTCKQRLNASFSSINSCPSQDVGLYNTTQFSNKISCHWEFGDGRSSDSFQPQLQYKYGDRIYKVKLVVKELNSICKDTASNFIQIYPQPDSRFGNFIKWINNEKYRQLIAYNCNPIECTFTWKISGLSPIHITGSNGLLIKDTFNSKKLNITLIVNRDDGCSSQSSQNFNVVDLNSIAFDDIHLTKNSGHWVLNQIPADCNLKVYDLNGQLVQNSNIENNQFELTELPKGLYIMKLEFQNGHIKTFKVFED